MRFAVGSNGGLPKPELTQAGIFRLYTGGVEGRRTVPVLDIDVFSRAVAGIYDASMDVERWPDALAQLAAMFGGTSSQITVASSLSNIEFLKTWGLSEANLAQTLSKFAALTPTDPRREMLATLYKATHCRQFVSDEELRTSEMYKQVLGPNNVEYCMCLVIPVDQQTVLNLAVMRGPQLSPFTAEDCVDFGRFAPHATRATSLHGTFRRCRDELATVKALLDGVPLGMMVVDDDELKVVNRAAQTMLDEGNALRLYNGRLGGATTSQEAKLHAALDEARSDGNKPIGISLPIDYAEPIRGLARKLHPDSAHMVGVASEAVALYLTDPRRPLETPEEILQRLFGLTPREASLLRLLAKGEDLQTAAAQLGITFETARSYLKRIMETTGVNRQAELVHLVLSSPAWIAGGYSSPFGCT
jgi:DNA-binding CsgD family transcriptional regulator